MQALEDRIARGLAMIINIIDPDIIILGGGLSNIERLYENIPRKWAGYVFPIKLIRSYLNQNMATLVVFEAPHSYLEQISLEVIS